MGLSSIKVNNSVVTSVDDKPTFKSENFVKSEGLINALHNHNLIKFPSNDIENFRKHRYYKKYYQDFPYTTDNKNWIYNNLENCFEINSNDEFFSPILYSIHSNYVDLFGENDYSIIYYKSSSTCYRNSVKSHLQLFTQFVYAKKKIFVNDVMSITSNKKYLLFGSSSYGHVGFNDNTEGIRGISITNAGDKIYDSRIGNYTDFEVLWSESGNTQELAVKFPKYMIFDGEEYLFQFVCFNECTNGDSTAQDILKYYPMQAVCLSNHITEYDGLDDIPEEEYPSDEITETLNIQNSDKICFYGCSYTESAYAIKQKDWVNKLGNYLDIQCHNFGVSGNKIVDIAKRLKNGANPFSTVTLDQLKPTYCIIQNNGNERVTSLFDQDYYIEEVRKACEMVKSYGAQPMLGSDFFCSQAADAALREFANRNGYLCHNIGTVTQQFQYHKYEGFWGGSHPGTRTNSATVMEYQNWLRNLNVYKCIKVYRLREHMTTYGLNDLLYDTPDQRIFKWNEIDTGALSLRENTESHNGWEYYDRLNEKNGSSWAYSWYYTTNEYCNLIDKSGITFSNYALIEFILPKVKCTNTRLYIRTNYNVKFYLLDAKDGLPDSYNSRSILLPVPQGTYQSFNNIPVNRSFTHSSNNSISMEYKYKFRMNTTEEYFICFFINSETNLNLPAGSVTDLVTSNTYNTYASKLDLGMHSYSFWELYRIPISETIEQTPTKNGDLYIIDVNDQKYFQYDKIRLIVNSENDFVLNEIYCEFSGGDIKQLNKNIHTNIKPSGTPLFNDTSMGLNSLNSNWSLSGSAVFKKYTNAQYPTTNSDYSVISLSIDNNSGFSGKMKRNISISPSRGYRTAIIRVIAQNYPKIFDTTKTPNEDYTNIRQITSDSFDLATICLEVELIQGNAVMYRRYVDVSWQELEFEVKIPPYSTNLNLTLFRDEFVYFAYQNIKSNFFDLQVCDVSVEMLK